MSQPPPFSHPGFHGRIGVAREDITPPIGIYARNWGAASHDTGEGIHRPLTLTAMTIQPSDGGEPLALVAVDLGWWRRPSDEWAVRGPALEALGLDESRLIVSLGHTHAAPVISKDNESMPGGDLIPAYAERVREALILAVRRARDTAGPACLEWAYGQCTLATERDLPDPNADRVVCGFHPGAPADPTLLVGRATRDDGTPLATVVNYACHPTTLAWDNRLISPDYVGAMREVVEAHTHDAPCLFIQGASGELAPRHQYVGDTAVADRHGRQLGFAVLSSLQGMLPPATSLVYRGVVESGAPLAHWVAEPRQLPGELAAEKIEIELDVRNDLPSLTDIRRRLAEQTDDRVLSERLLRQLGVRAAVGDGHTARRSAWAWRVGEALFFGQPEEAYSRLQVELRRRHPDRAVVVMNLINGSVGYLAPRELYRRNIYQVWQSPYAAGGLERLIDTADRRLAAMT